MKYKCTNCKDRTLTPYPNKLQAKRQDEYICTRVLEEKNEKGEITKVAVGCGYKLIVPKAPPKTKKKETQKKTS